MRILLTAFEPFDETGINAGLEGCRACLNGWEPPFELHFAVLPVEYGPDTEAVEKALREGDVDVILHTGQYTGVDHICVERVAINVRYPGHPPACLGRRHILIEPGGPNALFSTLPVDDVAEAIYAAGVPAGVSNHAGIYLCNHVLYQSLRRAERWGTAPPAGFLHVPCLPEQAPPGVPSMEAAEIGRGIRIALECLAEFYGTPREDVGLTS